MRQNRLHPSALGVALRDARKAASRSKADLARALDLSRPTLDQAEAGRGRLDVFARILDALDLEIAGRSLPPGEHLGQRLAALRARTRTSRRALAERAGISPTTLAALERGDAGHLAAAEAAAGALGAGLYLAPKGAAPGFWRTAATSSAHQAWTTPPELLARLYPVIDADAFDLDPCSPTADRRAAPVRARSYFTGRTPEDDGLSLPWLGRVFVNPPYGRGISEWVRKAHQEAAEGRAAPCIALIPARPDTAWWHTHVARVADAYMLRGRLRFGAEGGGDAAPFPSALVLWGADASHRARMSEAFPDAWHVPATIG